jgi:hypothetical protein
MTFSFFEIDDKNKAGNLNNGQRGGYDLIILSRPSTFSRIVHRHFCFFKGQQTILNRKQTDLYVYI